MSSIDTLIIGGGLTGLILTHRLHQAGKNVALVEARESLGGRYYRQNPVAPYCSNGLDFIPALNENLQLVEWIRKISPLSLRAEVEDHKPQIYDEARWRPFAGFGHSDFASVGELTHFCHTSSVNLEPGLEHLVRALVEQLPIVADVRCEVTSFKTDGGRVTEVLINGERSVPVNDVVFTAHPGLLNELIPGEGLNAKSRTRIAKLQPWTAVTLELKLATRLTDDSAIRIFSHGAKDFEPVVGRVFGETSRWMTLVPQERELEHEYIGQCIRHIKRQLKRAWPAAFDGQVEEKIFVQSNALGQQSLKSKETYRLPELNNLWLANHILASRFGEISSLEAAHAVELCLLGGTPISPVRQESGADF